MLPAARRRPTSSPAPIAERRVPRHRRGAATSTGPHLDDIVLHEHARELRAFGSQGEQRTAVLALLLAEATLLTELRGAPPVLLLDDVLSELDADRRARLLRAVRGVGQAIVTTTEAAHLPEPADRVLPSCGALEATDPAGVEARRRSAGGDAAAVVGCGVAAADPPRLARRRRRAGGRARRGRPG